MRSADPRIVGNNKLVISGNKKIKFYNPHAQIRSLAEGLNGILGKKSPRTPVCLNFKVHTIKKGWAPLDSSISTKKPIGPLMRVGGPLCGLL